MWLFGPTIDIGPLSLQTTGVFVLWALLLAYALLALGARGSDARAVDAAESLLWEMVLVGFALSRLAVFAQSPSNYLARPFSLLVGALGPGALWGGLAGALGVVAWSWLRRRPCLAAGLDLLARPVLGAAAVAAAGQTADGALSSLIFLLALAWIRPSERPGEAALAAGTAVAAGLAVHETLLGQPGPIIGLQLVPAALFALAFLMLSRLRGLEARTIPEPVRPEDRVDAGRALSARPEDRSGGSEDA